MIGKIITILAALSEMVIFLIRQRKSKIQEQEIEKAKQDPAKWFGDHFNGQPVERVQPDGEHANVPADAATTGETIPAKPDKN